MDCRFPLVEESAAQDPCPRLMRSPGEKKALGTACNEGPLES